NLIPSNVRSPGVGVKSIPEKAHHIGEPRKMRSRSFVFIMQARPLVNLVPALLLKIGGDLEVSGRAARVAESRVVVKPPVCTRRVINVRFTPRADGLITLV